MVVLPADFVKTKYDGYFWNVREKRLYSIKVGGILRPLALRNEWWVRHLRVGDIRIPKGYDVSLNGQRKRYPLKELLELKAKDVTETEVIPMLIGDRQVEMDI